MIGGSNPLNPFGSPTLDGEYDFDNMQVGTPLKPKSGGRQFVRFFNHTQAQVYTTKAKINEKTGSSTPLETDVRQVTKEMVEIVTPGDKNKVCDVATEWHKRVFWRQYKAFRDGKTGPIGMPIEEAQFIAPNVATELKYLGCHTVEQLADASDVLCGNIASGFEMREFAKAYCKAQMANKDSPKVILLSKEIETLRAEIAAMRGSPSPIVENSSAPVERVRRSPARPKSVQKEAE